MDPDSADKSKSFYLRHVRFRQIFPEIKRIVLVWAVLSVALTVILAIFSLGVGALTSLATLGVVPAPVWICVVFALFTWIARGETFTVPKYSFKSWLWLNAVIAVVVTVIFFLQKFNLLFLTIRWTIVPLLLAIFIFGPIAFRKLVKLGRRNYEAQPAAKAARHF